jgi:predicted HicB family RNase H-like nuclease
MRKEKLSTSITFRIAPNLKARLEQMAESDGRSLSNYLAWLLERHATVEPKPDASTGKRDAAKSR